MTTNQLQRLKLPHLHLLLKRQLLLLRHLLPRLLMPQRQLLKLQLVNHE